MSFLLRDNRGPGKASNDKHKLFNAAASLGRPSSHARTHNNVSGRRNQQVNRSVQHGNQLQIQRSTQRNQRQQTNNMQANAQQRSHHQDTTGVISMSEVLADIRVLEQQQIEAQQKLATARTTKEQRQQQHAGLESSLESRKYKNGQRRAQVRRSHEMLSTVTRKLGQSRLDMGSESDRIRNFERKLKIGLHCARVIATCRRKIDSTFIVAKSKDDAMARLNEEANQKLSTIESAFNQVTKQDATLRHSIQEQTNAAQGISKDTASMRSESSSKLEKELMEAQSSEESWKLRATNASTGVSEGQEQRSVLIEDQAKGSLPFQQFLSDLDLKEGDGIRARETKLQELQVIGQQSDLLASNGDVSVVSKSPDTGAAVLDQNALRLTLEGFKSDLHSQETSELASEEALEKFKVQTVTSVQEAIATQESCIKLSKETALINTQQKSNKEEIDSFQEELKQSHESVTKLEEASRDHKDSTIQASSTSCLILQELDANIETTRKEVQLVKTTLDEGVDEDDTKDQECLDEKKQLQDQLDAVKSDVKEVERTLHEMEQTLQECEGDDEKFLSEQLDKLNDSRSEIMLFNQSKIDNNLKKHLALEDVKVEYDPKLTAKQQAIVVLKPLRAKLESESKAERLLREKESKKRSDSLHEAQAAAAEVLRRDDKRQDRRRSSKATQSEKEDDAGLSRGDVKTQRKGKPDRRHKPADFYFPESREESDDDETPSQPKRLLSRFATTKEGSKSLSLDKPTPTPEGDKRVRWKDDTKRPSRKKSSLVVKPSARTKVIDEPHKGPHPGKKYGATDRSRLPKHKRSNGRDDEVMASDLGTDGASSKRHRDPTKSVKDAKTRTSSAPPERKTKTIARTGTSSSSSLHRRKKSSSSSMKDTIVAPKATAKPISSLKSKHRDNRSLLQSKSGSSRKTSSKTKSDGTTGRKKSSATSRSSADGSHGPKKRKSSHMQSSQSAGLSSAEMAPKARRRKKSLASSQKSGSSLPKQGKKSVTDYDFHF